MKPKTEPSLFAKIFLAMITPWTSQRLWLAIVCLLFLFSLFWSSVYHLYSFSDPAHVVAFESMFQTIAWAATTVVIGYILDMPTLLNGFKRSVVSSTAQVVQNLVAKEEVKIEENVNVTVTEKYDPEIEKKYADLYATDQSYRPPATVPDSEIEDFR